MSVKHLVVGLLLSIPLVAGAATETVIGDDTASDNALRWYRQDRAVGMEFTASWTGAASSVQVTTGYAWIAFWSGSHDVKMLVYNDSDTLIGTSNATTFSDTSYNCIKTTFTFGSAVTIAKNSVYRLAIIADGLWLKFCGDGTGSNPDYDSTGSYASPSSSYTVSGQTTDTIDSVDIYLEADTAAVGSSTALLRRRRE